MKYKFIVTGYLSVKGTVIIEAENDLVAFEKFKMLKPDDLNLKSCNLNKDRITYEVIKDVESI